MKLFQIIEALIPDLRPSCARFVVRPVVTAMATDTQTKPKGGLNDYAGQGE